MRELLIGTGVMAVAGFGSVYFIWGHTGDLKSIGFRVAAITAAAYLAMKAFKVA